MLMKKIMSLNQKIILYELLKNKVFDKYKSVSVIQNIHLNFCNNKNVYKCYYNPYKLKYINQNQQYHQN